MERLLEFSVNHWVLVSAFLFISGWLAYTLLGDTIQGIQSVSPIEATSLLNHEDGAMVIDVREPHEFNEGHILNALHIPLGSLADRLDKLQKHKNHSLIIACQSGYRSANACKQLKKQGFTKVYNLRGGILAWRNADLPTQKPK